MGILTEQKHHNPNCKSIWVTSNKLRESLFSESIYYNTLTWILWSGMAFSQLSCPLRAFKVPKKTIEDHVNAVHETQSRYLHGIFLSHKGYLVAWLWSRDQPVSGRQCQLFCICWAYTWHDPGLAGIWTKSDHPSYAMPANCITMQVFRDIAPVTVELIDWCCRCGNGITGPVKSEIHQCCLHK